MGKKRSKTKNSKKPLPSVIPSLSSPIKIEEKTLQAKQQVISSMFSGPLPPPATLQGYEHSFPGAAERIFKMAEKEQAHRHACDLKELESLDKDRKSNRASEKLGQVLACGVCLSLFGCGTFTIYLGHPFIGSGLMLMALGGIVGSLIKGRSMIDKKQPPYPPLADAEHNNSINESEQKLPNSKID